LKIDDDLTPQDLRPAIDDMWRASAAAILSIEETSPPGTAAPVFTVEGQYTARGWTEWTQGFQYGAAVLQFDATGDEMFLELARSRTLDVMAPHLSHTGVHDHGFNNVSTYGGLWRLIREGSIVAEPYEQAFYEVALKASAAVQASRWTPTEGGGGFVHSFNGPHSLFVDTIRTCRVMSLGHLLGHVLMAEQDERISLLDRALAHARSTAEFNVFYGEGRDSYDVWGRTAHEAIFNVNNGVFRCPGTQQGYSGFSTWTRGLSWAVSGFSEQLEFLDDLPDDELGPHGGRDEVTAWMLRAARATADFYIDNTALDGIPYWDTGAPGLAEMPGWRDEPAAPDNEHEPVDSSAAAITAQGLLRLGRWLSEHGQAEDGQRYYQAGLTVARTLLGPEYLSADPDHQGLLLHSVYHRPNGWDHVPGGRGVPRGESSMWGDYHMRELALLVQRLATGETYPRFCGPVQP
jgi:hypothetical protein